ncbi:hypothetical protein R6Q59_035702, partial [Mikania micrantha]
QNIYHRRSIAASLVHGVYVLEKDRQRRSIGHEHDTHAPPWWERFHFKFNRVLVDDNDLSYFGAIYELKYAHSFRCSLEHCKNGRSRKHMVSRTLVRRINRNARRKENGKVSVRSRNAGIATSMKRCNEESEEDPFIMLSEWIPYVFVNPLDLICVEYIGSFQHRDKMDDIGMGKIERIAAKDSIVSLGSRAVGRESEPLHLLLTAYLTMNRSLAKGVKKAHKIHQWWQQDFEGSSKLYRF